MHKPEDHQDWKASTKRCGKRDEPAQQPANAKPNDDAANKLSINDRPKHSSQAI